MAIAPQPIEPFAISSTEDSGKLILQICGELDVGNCESFESEIKSANWKSITTVVLDMNEVGFIDSSGLRALISSHALATSNDSRLVIARPSEPVLRLLQLTQLDGHLTVVGSLDDVEPA
jgi:anti-sigma B factor antagonist